METLLFSAAIRLPPGYCFTQEGIGHTGETNEGYHNKGREDGFVKARQEKKYSQQIK